MCSLDKNDLICGISNCAISEKNSSCSNLCKKCQDKGKVVLEKRHVYCRNCFLAILNHKFRSIIGRYKLIMHADRVMVTFSGNFVSSSLLHLIHCTLKNTSHKKLMFKPIILYIDAEIFASTNMRKETLMKIEKLIRNYDYDSYIIPIEAILHTDVDVYLKQFNELVDFKYNLQLNEKMKFIFKNQGSSTHKEDLLALLSNQLSIEVAKHLVCNKIITSDSCDTLAIQALTCIAEGRGYHLPFNMAVCDSRSSDVKIIRPLKEFTLKEIAFYAVFNKLDFVNVLPWHDFYNSNSSINRLVKLFVSNLQDKFPATVHTICHTGDKLKMCTTKNSSVNGKICDLCKLPLDVDENYNLNENTESNITPVNDDDGLSSAGYLKDSNDDFNFLNAITDVIVNSGSRTDNDVFKRLCYGCRQLYELMRK